MSEFSPIHGLVAAPHVPLSPAGQVDFDVLPRQIEFLAGQGLAGVFVNGTTGEGFSLTGGERRKILEAWVRHAPDSLRVIVHVGHHSVVEAADLAGHAASVGAAAISAVGPSFVKPGDARALIDFCAPIAAAAPALPFYYYHIPGLSGVNVSMPEFLKLRGGRIPNLAGIKFTHPDLYEFQRCLAVDDGRFDILWGVDEALLGALAVGAKGAVGSTYNYAAPLYLSLMKAFAEGDLSKAQRSAATSVRLVEILLDYGVFAAGKALMGLHGVDCGQPRPPAAALSDEAKASLLCSVESLLAS